MKSVIHFAASCFAIGMMILSASCNKKAGVERIPGEADANYWPDQRYCNIDSIKITYNGDWYDFTYDAQGDPVSIITNTPSTGDPNRYFYYDANKRLSVYVGNAPHLPGEFQFHTVYVYGANNRVIRDTTYNWGTYVNGVPTNPYSWTVSYYSYDSLNRISQVVFTWEGVPGSGFITNYNYDANGNLIRSGITYDNRNNIHNTNKWWRLIDREYSKNNPYTATTYTGYWLPRDFISSMFTNDRYFLGMDLQPHASIKYICD